MKKTILILLTSIFWTTSNGQSLYKKVILKELKSTFQDSIFQKYNQTGKFHYDSNKNLIKRTLKSDDFDITVKFEYENDTIRQKYLDRINTNGLYKSITYYEYKKGKIFTETHYEIIKNKEVIKNINRYSYSENKIIKKTFLPEKEVPEYTVEMKLDSKQNILTIYNSYIEKENQPQSIYDNMTTPTHITLPKYLNGSTLFLAGNIISFGKDTRYEYEYNKYNLPIIEKKFVNEKIQTIIEYKYE